MRLLTMLLAIAAIGIAASYSTASLAPAGCAASVQRLKGNSILRMSGGSDKKISVGFIGQGIMGVPMAKNLLKAGYEVGPVLVVCRSFRLCGAEGDGGGAEHDTNQVKVWNRTPTACEPTVAEGATQGSSPAELVEQCDVVFAMLSDPPA